VANGVNGFGGQGLVDDATDVIGLEDLGGGNEHAENSGAKTMKDELYAAQHDNPAFG